MANIRSGATAGRTSKPHPIFDRGAARCRRCDSAMERISRHPLMRFLLGSMHYRCPDCNRRYLRFLGKLFPLWPA